MPSIAKAMWRNAGTGCSLTAVVFQPASTMASSSTREDTCLQKLADDFAVLRQADRSSKSIGNGCVGGDTFHACSRSMAWNGRLLVVGFAGGEIPQFPVNLSLVKGYSVVGVFWGSFTQHQPQDFAANMKELLNWYVQGKVKVIVDDVLPLANAQDALNKVMGREVMGKMTLKP